jgi:hypothetical protein
VDAGESLWTRRRRDLHAALSRVDQVIAGLYEQMIDCLDRPLVASRLVVAAHCAREMANNLVDHLGDVEGLPEYVGGSKQRQELARTWVAHEAALGPYQRPVDTTTVTGESVSTPLMPVPRELVERTRQIVEIELGAPTRAGQRSSALVTGRLDLAEHASVRLFRESVRFFQRYAHLRHGEPIDLPDREELLRQLVRLEEPLMGRVGDFFARKAEIMDLLARANVRTQKSQE